MTRPGHDIDALVVGAGPAGLTAARTLAEAGARVLVLDEYDRPGGQYFKQPIPDLAPMSRESREGESLIGAVMAAGAGFLAGATLIGRNEDRSLLVRTPSGLENVSATVTVVATGAYDRTIAFPGWDLPGVLTPGGAQTLAKAQGIRLPGPVVLAGSGPFLMPVGYSLLKAGIKVAGIYEMGSPLRWAKSAGALLAHGARLAELCGYAAYFLRKGVRVRFGWRVVRAEGRDRVERVVLARCDEEGRIVAGSEIEKEAAFLCVGHGFVTAAQVTMLLGCDHVFYPNQGGWAARHDQDMQTSVPGIFVAGEAAGVGGVHCALAEGRLAGLSAAAALGLDASPDEVARARAGRASHRAFARLVADLFPVRTQLYRDLDDSVTVCRCEEVTAGDVRAACASWMRDVNSVKAATRCGMGMCQGRVCGHHLAALVAHGAGVTPEDLGPPSVRPPLKPVAVSEWLRVDTMPL